MSKISLDFHVAICLELARAGIPPDLVELLVQGDPMRGVSPLALDRAISTALEASGMAVVPGWQPIESAPKDGTFIDLWLGNDEDPHRRTDCYWGRPHHECGEYGSYCDNCPPDRDMWVDPLSMGHEDLSPTHWMPAALPPRSE